MAHDLKTWPIYFDAVWNGMKTFELRKDDRDFGVGDELRLMEYFPSTGTFSGREVRVVVTYLVKNAPAFGLMWDHVILGFDPATRVCCGGLPVSTTDPADAGE